MKKINLDKRNCYNCKYSVDWSGVVKKVVKCHRYPPTPIIRNDVNYEISLFPVVIGDDFCFEWKKGLDK